MPLPPDPDNEFSHPLYRIEQNVTGMQYELNVQLLHTP